MGFGLCVFGSGILQFGLMGFDICVLNGSCTHEYVTTCINGFRHLRCEWFVHSRMEKGVASAIWWIRSTMLQVRVNLSPFALNFVDSFVLGGLDVAKGSFGDYDFGTRSY